jgi:hypothetical protein
MSNRRLPPPWSVEDNGACFIVSDGAGQNWPMSISRMSSPTSGSQSYSHAMRRARCAAYSKETKIAKAVSIAAGPY